jgi:metallo-beta-lactamase class B
MKSKYVVTDAAEAVKGGSRLFDRRRLKQLVFWFAIGAAATASIAATLLDRFKVVQDPTKIWIRSALPFDILDTPEVKVEVAKSRALAGDDDYLLTLQRVQSNDFDDTYTVVKTPGANVIPPDAQSSGRREVAAVPTKVFDNVYYVGGWEVGGWVIDTGDGYIMLDSSYDYGFEEILLPGMRKLGLDPSKVKYILVTHAGPDHLGAARKFQDTYGTKVLYTAPIAANPAFLPNPPVATIVKDGDTLTLGNTTITMVSTPRTVGGTGLSYFIPVTVNGTKHLWATYGNTGIVGTLADKAEYTRAIRNFIDNYVTKLKPDIAMSSHPFADGSINRMRIIRDNPGIATPFLIGEEMTKTYFEIMAQGVKVQAARQAAGLNSSGTGKL